jgi:hypothetical protein
MGSTQPRETPALDVGLMRVSTIIGAGGRGRVAVTVPASAPTYGMSGRGRYLR